MKTRLGNKVLLLHILCKKIIAYHKDFKKSTSFHIFPFTLEKIILNPLYITNAPLFPTTDIKPNALPIPDPSLRRVATLLRFTNQWSQYKSQMKWFDCQSIHDSLIVIQKSWHAYRTLWWWLLKQTFESNIEAKNRFQLRRRLSSGKQSVLDWNAKTDN